VGSIFSLPLGRCPQNKTNESCKTQSGRLIIADGGGF